jgi:hypothetical protein
VWAVPAEDSHACTLVKGIEAINWEILLIEGVVSNELGLDLADDWEHVWLAIIVSVGTDSEVALLRILIVLEIDREAQDRIRWGEFDVGELVVQQSEALHFE